MFRVISAGLLLAFVAGCGGGGGADATYAVSGTIKFDDGSPVTQGSIHFRRAGSTAGGGGDGQIGSDGSFVVGTYTEDDGLSPGEYKVYLSSTGAEEAVADDGPDEEVSEEDYTGEPDDYEGPDGYMEEGGETVAEEFLSFETTTLTASVKEQANTFELTVSKPSE